MISFPLPHSFVMASDIGSNVSVVRVKNLCLVRWTCEIFPNAYNCLNPVSGECHRTLSVEMFVFSDLQTRSSKHRETTRGQWRQITRPRRPETGQGRLPKPTDTRSWLDERRPLSAECYTSVSVFMFWCSGLFAFFLSHKYSLQYICVFYVIFFMDSCDSFTAMCDLLL